MRYSLAFLISVLAFTLAAAACGGDNKGSDAEPFDTLLACYDDHHNKESLPVQQAIVVCCVDHPIAGVHPSCKDTQSDCVAHVTAELGSAVSASDVEAACTTYLQQK